MAGTGSTKTGLLRLWLPCASDQAQNLEQVRLNTIHLIDMGKTHHFHSGKPEQCQDLLLELKQHAGRWCASPFLLLPLSSVRAQKSLLLHGFPVFWPASLSNLRSERRRKAVEARKSSIWKESPMGAPITNLLTEETRSRTGPLWE